MAVNQPWPEYPDRDECTFTELQRPITDCRECGAPAPFHGAFCSIGMEAMRAAARSEPVTAIPVVDGGRPYEPKDPAHEAAHGLQRTIMRIRDAAMKAMRHEQAIVMECDRALDELNGGGW